MQEIDVLTLDYPYYACKVNRRQDLQYKSAVEGRQEPDFELYQQLDQAILWLIDASAHSSTAALIVRPIRSVAEQMRFLKDRKRLGFKA